MANNLDVKDAAGASRTVKTTDNAGVHTPSQNVDQLASGQTAHDAAASGNPVRVAGRSSAAAPTAVSADGDAVEAWYLQERRGDGRPPGRGRARRRGRDERARRRRDAIAGAGGGDERDRQGRARSADRRRAFDRPHDLGREHERDEREGQRRTGLRLFSPTPMHRRAISSSTTRRARRRWAATRR